MNQIGWEQEWDRIYKNQGEVQKEILPTVEIAAEIFKKNNCKVVMDLGCGTGRHSIYLAQLGFEVWATDISETGLRITREKADKLNLKNIKFKEHDMRRITFENETFDGIICVWTTGHGNYEDALENVNEIYRVLKPGGIVVIDYVSTEDENYGRGIKIDRDTFIKNVEGEEDIPHHYSSLVEISKLYGSFQDIEIKPIDYYFNDSFGIKHTINAFVVVAKK